MNSMKYFPGAEFEGVIIEFRNPNEFNCTFIDENEYIKISEFTPNDNTCPPNKNEIVQYKKFAIRVGDEYVMCEVTKDLKKDEVNCQVLLCNTSAILKVNYQSLRIINEDIFNEAVLPLKIYDFAPQFLKSWNDNLISNMKDKVLFNRFIIQFKSTMPDPVDGRYPVCLLDIVTKKSITNQFIDDKLAIHYSDYYEKWLEHERNKIFETEETEERKYAISAPMFKNRSAKDIKTNPMHKYKLNVEAIPFTPTASNTNLDTSNDAIGVNTSTFNFENIPGFTNGTIVSNYVSSDNQAPSFMQKLSLVPRIDKSFTFNKADTQNPYLFSTPDSISATKRVKKGLEVLSPISDMKPINSAKPVSNNTCMFKDSFVLDTDLQLSEKLRACSVTPQHTNSPQNLSSLTPQNTMFSTTFSTSNNNLTTASSGLLMKNTPASSFSMSPQFTASTPSLSIVPNSVNSTSALSACNPVLYPYSIPYLPLPYPSLGKINISPNSVFMNQPIAANLPTQPLPYMYFSRNQ